jgi:hypothetical protein
MGLIDDAKEAVKLVQKIDNIELYRKILDLQNEAMQLIEQLREKDEEIAQLKNISNVEIRDNFAYKIEGNDVLGPYCPRCLGRDTKLVYLINADEAYGCAICQFILNKNGKGLESRRKNYLIGSYLT